MARKALFICIVLSQFVRVAAYAAVAGDFCCADEMAATSSVPVSKIVKNSLIYQLELLTKIASLACAITQNKTPEPQKAPAPISHTATEIIIPESSSTLSKQYGQSQTAVLNDFSMRYDIVSSAVMVQDPPGVERTPQRLFALARGGLDGASASIFFYCVNQTLVRIGGRGFFIDSISDSEFALCRGEAVKPV